MIRFRGKCAGHAIRGATLLSVLVAGQAQGASSLGQPGSPASAGSLPAASLRALPLSFERNRGQFAAPVRFAARSEGGGLLLTSAGATLSTRRAQVSLRLAGARRDVEPAGVDVQPGMANYFVGNDRSRWRTNVETYARVRYAGVLPGVDLLFYGTDQGRFEYDLVVAPGTDPEAVTVQFGGVDSWAIGADGAAILHARGGETIVQPAPVAYQLDGEGRRIPVASRYVRRRGGLGFAVGAYDPSKTVVIDPSVVYATYLGTNRTHGYAVAASAAGELYIAGSTLDFGSPLPACGACSGGAAFVSKLNAAGTALVYSTYFGGAVGDAARGIAINAAGEAYVVGQTYSNNFPTVSPIQAKHADSYSDAFVAKLNASGSALLYSTYLGGEGGDFGQAIAVNAAGEAYVVGVAGRKFPTTPGAFQTAAPSDSPDNAFVAKLKADGSALVYSTYLGGSVANAANAIAVGAQGEAFVVGSTSSTDFPTVSPLRGAPEKVDAFVTKLKADGSGLVYSTFLGGQGADVANGVAVNAAGEAFVAGQTNSLDFPTVSAFQATGGGDSQDGFVAKLKADGSGFVYSTYLGGKPTLGYVDALDKVTAIAIDPAGHAFVTGNAGSTLFPKTLSITKNILGLFVAELDVSGSALVYSVLFGGSAAETTWGIAVDGAGAAYATGETGSGDFSTVSPMQDSIEGINAFAIKIAPGDNVDGGASDGSAGAGGGGSAGGSGAAGAGGAGGSAGAGGGGSVGTGSGDGSAGTGGGGGLSGVGASSGGGSADAGVAGSSGSSSPTGAAAQSGASGAGGGKVGGAGAAGQKSSGGCSCAITGPPALGPGGALPWAVLLLVLARRPARRRL